jgi:hypothetical protein
MRFVFRRPCREMGYSAKSILTGTKFRLVSPITHLFHHIEGLLDTREHYLATGPVKSVTLLSSFQSKELSLAYPDSKEDWRPFILLCDKHPEIDSATILAVNCNPMPGNKIPSTSRSYCQSDNYLFAILRSWPALVQR